MIKVTARWNRRKVYFVLVKAYGNGISSQLNVIMTPKDDVRTKILYLPHRLPFPPNKGDKVRGFNFLKHLAKNNDLFVGSFIDDKADLEAGKLVQQYAVASYIQYLNPKIKRLLSLKGLVTGAPLTVSYFENNNLKRWVSEIVKKESIDTVLIYSSTMSQFIEGNEFEAIHRVADFADVDSEKWRTYSQISKWPLRMIYAREARTLLEYERKIALSFKQTVFVSKEEAQLFKSIAPESADKTTYVEMGVDTEYFDPSGIHVDSLLAAQHYLVFTGAMDYKPNIDSVTWFVSEIWPTVLAKHAKLKFYIVGSNPVAAVKALRRAPNVIVTGRVGDVRPYLLHAVLAVAPLRVARGTQIKVLEAMAMAKHVVCTSAAAEGLHEQAKLCLNIANSAEQFVQLLNALSVKRGINFAARNAAIKYYSWPAKCAELDQILRLSATAITAPIVGQT